VQKKAHVACYYMWPPSEIRYNTTQWSCIKVIGKFYFGQYRCNITLSLKKLIFNLILFTKTALGKKKWTS